MWWTDYPACHDPPAIQTGRYGVNQTAERWLKLQPPDVRSRTLIVTVTCHVTRVILTLCKVTPTARPWQEGWKLEAEAALEATIRDPATHNLTLIFKFTHVI